jgi:hypothetical protein
MSPWTVHQLDAPLTLAAEAPTRSVQNIDEQLRDMALQKDPSEEQAPSADQLEKADK